MQFLIDQVTSGSAKWECCILENKGKTDRKNDQPQRNIFKIAPDRKDPLAEKQVNTHHEEEGTNQERSNTKGIVYKKMSRHRTQPAKQIPHWFIRIQEG